MREEACQGCEECKGIYTLKDNERIYCNRCEYIKINILCANAEDKHTKCKVCGNLALICVI